MMYCIELTETETIDVRIALENEFNALLDHCNGRPEWFDIGRLKSLARLYFVLNAGTWHMLSLEIQYYER